MAYQVQWKAEIAAMQRVLADLPMKEERTWGKPTYTVEGKNIVIIQGFKEYLGLGFFRGALLKDPRFKRAFEALTPGRQRGCLYHFAAAKQSATRQSRIEKAMPAIFEGRGFLDRG